MLTLRLTLAAAPLALLLRLLLLCASAGVGLLLLSALSHALEHPRHPDGSLLGLLWCLVPLAVTAQLAAALGRTEPSPWTRAGLDAAGLGPARLPLLAARTAALPCVVGGALALLVTAGPGRGEGGPASTTAGPLLPGQPLPTAAALTLLSTLPLVAALAAAWGTHRTVATGPAPGTTAAPHAPYGAHEPSRPVRGTGTGGLAAGALLIVAGLLLAGYAARHAPGHGFAHPSRPRAADVAASPLAAGWLLAALGLIVTGPALAALCGRMLAAGRPGAARLLAGRALEREAGWTGRPLATLSVLAAALLVIARAQLTGEGVPGPGPLGALAAALVAACAAGAALAALTRVRRSRAPRAELLQQLGADRKLARGAALLRAATTVGVFAVLALAAGLPAALPHR